GQGRRLLPPGGTIRWDFTRDDPLIGNAGLNCAGVNTNDSGGGTFVGDALVGIITGLLAQGFRTSLEDPATPGCFLNRQGHFFDASGYYRCTDSRPPLTRAHGAAVYPSLSNIFA